MASIYRQKGSKNWWVKVYEPGNPKPKRFSLETDNEDKARAKLKKIEAKQTLDQPIEPKADRLRFWQLADLVVNDYLVRKNRSLETLKNRLKNHIIPFFGQQLVRNIRTAQIEQYIAKRMEQGASDATINRELDHIKKAFRLGARDYPIQVPHIPKRKENNIRQGFFERDQLEALCQHLPSYLVAPVQFAYETGWRISEIRGLKERNVDFVGGEVRLDPGTTKNDDGRVFPMTETAELRALLETVIGEKRKNEMEAKKAGSEEKKTVTISPFVFTYRRRKNGPLLPIGDFGRAWARACHNAGLPCTVHLKRDRKGEIIRYKQGPKKGQPVMDRIDAEAIFHDFRRTAVRNLVRNGIPERVAMQMTGHRTREVFERYNIVSESDLREAAKKIDEAAERRKRSGIVSGIAVTKSVKR
jgi:integrase